MSFEKSRIPRYRRGRNNAIAKKYGVGVYKLTHKKQIEYIQELIGIAESKSEIETVLDCPCGAGRLGNYLSNFDLTCIDNHEGVINKARTNVKCAKKISVSNIFDLPFKENSYDLILTILLLQHIPNKKLPCLFDEIARVSRRWAIVTYSNKLSFTSFLRYIGKSSKNTLTQTDFNKHASQAGFKIAAKRNVLTGISSTSIVLLEK